MASLGDNRGPYEVDYKIVQHRDCKITTTLNSKVFDSMFGDDSNMEYEVAYIPAGVEHRPDLISNVFYGTPKNWWLLMKANNITDPFEGFNVGDRILVPIVK